MISNNNDEWESIVRQYNDGLLKYCYSILCNYADAEDAVQNTFIKVITKSDSIKNRNSIKSYLYKTAYRTSIDIIRNRKFKLFVEYQDNEQGYIENFDKDFPEELRVAFLKLKPFERALFYERTVNQTSYKELSILYHKSENSLRKRYERIRKKMFDFLKNGSKWEASLKHESKQIKISGGDGYEG
jgi:RNA polymerase sigma-70 factor (ECF subfamily)